MLRQYRQMTTFAVGIWSVRKMAHLKSEGRFLEMGRSFAHMA